MDEHSRSRRTILALMVILGSAIFVVASARAQQDISAEMARAQTLYYGAQFEQAIRLLLDLEKESEMTAADPMTGRK